MLRACHAFEPWLDEEELLPGQEWAREIPRALQTSDFILIFLSRNSVAKRGYVQREMKLALDAWQELPEGTIHTIAGRAGQTGASQLADKVQWIKLSEKATNILLSGQKVLINGWRSSGICNGCISGPPSSRR
jgi:TIR domain